MTADLVVAALLIEGLDAEIGWEHRDMARVELVGWPEIHVAVHGARAFVPEKTVRAFGAGNVIAAVHRAVAAANKAAAKVA